MLVGWCSVAVVLKGWVIGRWIGSWRSENGPGSATSRRAKLSLLSGARQAPTSNSEKRGVMRGERGWDRVSTAPEVAEAQEEEGMKGQDL